MLQPKRSTREPDIGDLLEGEIARLLMRADRVERREVDALMTRVLALRLRTLEMSDGEAVTELLP